MSTENDPHKFDGPLRIVVGSQFSSVHVGGAERYLLEVCKRLEKDHHMMLHYLSADRAAEEGLSSPCLHFMTTGFHPAWSKEIRSYLERLKPHAVYVHHTVPGLTDVLIREAGKLSIPTVLMYHSDVTGSDLLKKSIGFLYHYLIGKRSLTECRAIFLSSPAYADASPFLKGLGTRFVEAPPGVDSLMMSGKRSVEKPYLLFVGKPALKNKGFHILFQAWRQLKKMWVDLELVVIGSVKEHNLKWQQEGIKYMGYVSSRRALADCYASAAATVLPTLSTTESFGMVLAEALLAGCPIVGSKIGGIPALVEDGLNGYLFSPGDVTDLVNAIDRAMKHQMVLRSYILKKRKTYQALFSWDRTAEIVADTLRWDARGNL